MKVSFGLLAAETRSAVILFDQERASGEWHQVITEAKILFSSFSPMITQVNSTGPIDDTNIQQHFRTTT